VVSSTPRPHFTPRERPDTHFTGEWVGPRAGLDGRKISSSQGFDLGPSVAIPTVLTGPHTHTHTHTHIYIFIYLFIFADRKREYNIFGRDFLEFSDIRITNLHASR